MNLTSNKTSNPKAAKRLGEIARQGIIDGLNLETYVANLAEALTKDCVEKRIMFHRSAPAAREVYVASLDHTSHVQACRSIRRNFVYG